MYSHLLPKLPLLPEAARSQLQATGFKRLLSEILSEIHLKILEALDANF